MLAVSPWMFLNWGNESNFMLQPFVFIMCPCPFHLTLPPQRSSRLRWRRQAPPGLWGVKAPSPSLRWWWQQFTPASLAWSRLEFCNYLPFVFASWLWPLRCRRMDHRRGEGRGKAESGAERARAAMQMTLGGGLLFSLLISSNLFDPNFKTLLRVAAATFYVSPRAG